MADNTINRRQLLKYAAAAGMTGLAGCSSGGDGESGSTTTTSGSSGGDGGSTPGGESTPAGPENVMADWSFLQLNEPAPVSERLTGAEWTPPEFDDSNVADTVKYFNLGSMKHDPATAWFQDRLEERTGVTVEPIVVPSKRATPKITTVLSSESESPAMMQVDRQMYMDFVEPGWLEPVDRLWTEDEDVFQYFPKAYENEFFTDIDVSMEGEHNYMSVAISEGSVRNYRPDLLEDLGFERDFLKRPTWEDVREVCVEAKEQNKDYYGHVWYGGGVRYPSYPWMLKVWSQGETVVKDGKVIFNSDAGVKALRWQRQLIEEDLVPDVQQYGQGGPEDLLLGDGVVGYNGGSKMIPMALDQLGEDKYELGLPAKKGSNGEHATFLGTDCLCLNRFAPPEKKRAALLYMDGARSAEASAQEFVQEGNMPTNSAAWDLDVVQNEVPFKEIPQEAIQNAREGLWPRQIQTIEALVPELQAAWAGKKSPRKALDDAQEAVDEILRQ